MKIRIWVRHGHYFLHEGGSLHEIGKRQMSRLARLLQPHILDAKPCILSSSAPRGIESAQIIAGHFNVTIAETAESLWCEPGRNTRKAEVAELIQRYEREEVIIIVTHLEYVADANSSSAAEDYASTVLGIDGYTAPEISRGEAIVMDGVLKKAFSVRQM